MFFGFPENGVIQNIELNLHAAAQEIDIEQGLEKIPPFFITHGICVKFEIKIDTIGNVSEVNAVHGMNQRCRTASIHAVLRRHARSERFTARRFRTEALPSFCRNARTPC